MRRLNIKVEDKLYTKSFLDVEELEAYLHNDCGFIFNAKAFAKKIWNLDVGSKLIVDGFRFSINSKRRVGNQLTDGTIIGAKQ